MQKNYLQMINQILLLGMHRGSSNEWIHTRMTAVLMKRNWNKRHTVIYTAKNITSNTLVRYASHSSSPEHPFRTSRYILAKYLAQVVARREFCIEASIQSKSYWAASLSLGQYMSRNLGGQNQEVRQLICSSFKYKIFNAFAWLKKKLGTKHRFNEPAISFEQLYL